MFFATKRVRRDGSRAVGNDKMTAIAIREHESDKFAKVIRFLYNVPSLINENLETWIAVPKGCILNNVLFNKRDNLGAVVHPPSLRRIKNTSSTLRSRGCELFYQWGKDVPTGLFSDSFS